MRKEISRNCQNANERRGKEATLSRELCVPGPDSFVAGCLGRSKVRSGHRKKPCQLVRTSAAGGRASYCCPPRPGLWPVLRFLPGPPSCRSACRAQSPLPSRRHRRPGLLSLPRDPESPPLPSCPGLGRCPPPSPCRHAPSLGPDLHPAALEKLLFHPFPTLS